MNRQKREKEIEKTVNSAAALSGMTLSEDEKEDLRRILREEIKYEESLKRVIDEATEIRKKYGYPDAMKLSIEDRRKLINWIMEASRRAADSAAEIFIQNNPNLSQEDLEDEVIFVRARAGISRMLELKKQYGFPIARYDRESRQAYIEYPDGHKEFIEDIIKERTEYANPEKA